MIRVSRSVRFGAGMLAIALAALVSGCTGIPRSGGVNAGNVETSSSDIDVILLPDGPAPGASQEELLDGFLRAAASPQNDYAVARQFLSQSFSQVWDPNASTTVDLGSRAIERVNSIDFRLRVTPVAQVDAAGEYREDKTATALSLSYEFVSENGEWRIGAAPNGILLDQVRFDQVFSSHAVYFYDPSFTYLVPDLRWFPRLAATGTRIVRALLGGPSPWLQGAVVSAIPEGTSTTTVLVQSGQANVDLSPNVLELDVITQRRMAYQLRTSLSTVPGVSNIQVTVSQSPVSIVESAGSPPIVDPRVDARPLVIRDGVFGYLSGEQVSAVPDFNERVVALSPSAVMFSAGDGIAAVLSDAGASVVRAGADPQLLDNRANLIPPVVDTHGFVWSVPHDQPGQVTAFAPDGTGIPVATDWEGATGITAWELSRDGTRAAAMLTVGSVPKLVVAAVFRDPNGVPQRLGAPLELATGPGTAGGVTWVNQDEIASITQVSPTDSRVVVQQVGGKSRALGPLGSGLTIAGGNEVDGLRVRDEAGNLEQPRGSGWQQAGTSVTLLSRQY